jgi:hypothetical protein
MLVDLRTHNVRPGTLKSQLALYETHGSGPQKRHFGEPLVSLTSDTGEEARWRGVIESAGLKLQQ